MENINIAPIKTEEQYTVAMNNIRKLWDCPENSKEADVLEVLSIFIEDYEKQYYEIESEYTR